MTTNLEKSLQVDASVQEVYSQWADLSGHPRFMSSVHEIQPEGEDRWLCAGERHGQPAQWHIDQIELVPHESISWRITSQDVNGTSAVRFSALDEGLRTSIVYSAHYPTGLGKNNTAMDVADEMESSLRQFAALFEEAPAAEGTPPSAGRAVSAAQAQSETEEATQLGEEVQGSLEEATGALMGSILQAFDSPIYRFGQLIWDMEQQFSGFVWGNLEKTPAVASRALGNWTPAVELTRRGDHLVACAELPGYTAEHLHVEIRDGRLHISGERPLVGDVSALFGAEVHEAQEQEVRFHVTLSLSAPVMSSRVEAQLDKNGRLEITLPIKTAKPLQPLAIEATPQRETSDAGT